MKRITFLAGVRPVTLAEDIKQTDSSYVSEECKMTISRFYKSAVTNHLDSGTSPLT